MKVLDVIFAILLIIGGLNWGAVGAFNWNAVEAIFGIGTSATSMVYVLVGISALYRIIFCKSIRSRCGTCR